MDKHQFEIARMCVTRGKRDIKGVGTLSEKSLHAILKLYFEPNSSGHEIKIGPYIADIVGENGIIEIQTQGFNRLRDKLEAFLSVARVTVVYPIAKTKYLCWVDLDTGEVSERRKSPKKGTPHHAFFELYKIKSLLAHPNLNICIVMLDMEEYRWLNGWNSSRKRGSSRMERIPLALADELTIACPDDYAIFIPNGLSDSFTTRDFARETHIHLKDAQRAVHVLSYVGVLQKTGMQERFALYRKA